MQGETASYSSLGEGPTGPLYAYIFFIIRMSKTL